MWHVPKPPEEKPEITDNHTYVAELTPYQRLTLIALMKKQAVNDVYRGIIDALELAERLDLVSVERRDFWSTRERWAQAGYSIADQAFDGFGAKKNPKEGEK